MFKLGFLILWRSRFWLVASWFLVILAGVVFLSSQFSGRQPATVALDIGLSYLKLALPVVTALLFQELLAKEVDKRYFLYSLTYPFSRSNYIVARFLICFVVLLSLLVVGAIVISTLVSIISTSYDQSRAVSLGLEYWFVLSFFALDIFVISSVACLLSVVARTPGFVLIGTVGFAVVARSYGDIIKLLGGDMLVVAGQDRYESMLGLISLMIPDLGSLDIRYIALYDDFSSLTSSSFLNLVPICVFAIAVLSLSIWLFNRRELH